MKRYYSHPNHLNCRLFLGDSNLYQDLQMFSPSLDPILHLGFVL